MLKKNLVQIRLVVFEKNAHFNSKNDVIEPKVRRLGYSNNQLKTVNRLKVSFRLPKTMVSGNLKLIFSLLTD